MNHENIFGIVGKAMRELSHAGMHDEAKELSSTMWECKSYDEAVMLVNKFLGMIQESKMSEEEADAEWDRHWAGEEK